MNEQFIIQVYKSKKTPYQISKDTGIPYTTLSELVTGKKSINHIASETVYKLCKYFHCTMEDILNTVNLYVLQGKYKGINYSYCTKEDIVNLLLNDSIIATYQGIYAENWAEVLHANAKLCIEEYLDAKKKELEYDKLYSYAQK